MVQGQRAVRPLLLILVAFGIAYMHTVGHSSHGGHECGGGRAMIHAHQPPAGPAAAAVAMVNMTVAAVGPGCGTGAELDPFTVCLAILVAGVVVLLATLSVAGRRLLPLHGRFRSAPAITERGPPDPPGLGLRLADLSVLRT